MTDYFDVMGQVRDGRTWSPPVKLEPEEPGVPARYKAAAFCLVIALVAIWAGGFAW